MPAFSWPDWTVSIAVAQGWFGTLAEVAATAFVVVMFALIGFVIPQGGKAKAFLWLTALGVGTAYIVLLPLRDVFTWPDWLVSISFALAWLGWLLAVAANGFAVFMFVAFGLAASQGAAVKGFLWFTAIGVGVTLIVSLLLMVGQHFIFGIAVTAAWFPLLATVGCTWGALFKSR
jgi:hypothetical protein